MPVSGLAFNMCHGYDQYEARLNNEKDSVRKIWHETTPKGCM